MISGAVFQNRQVQRLFFAQLISQLCDRLMLVGVLWVISSTMAPRYAPWFIAVGALPHLLLARVAPAWIRSWGVLPTLIRGDAIRGAFLLAMAVLLAFWKESDLLIWILFVINLINNVFACPFNSAILVLPMQMDIPDVLRPKATALVEACLSLSSVLAPLLSVAAYAAFGLTGLIAINGVSYGVAAWIEQGIRVRHSGDAVPSIKPATPAGNSADLSVMAVVREQPLILYMLAGFLALNLFLGPLLAFIPLYARHVYHGTLGTVGLLEAAFGIGTVAGTAVLALRTGFARPLRWIAIFLLVDCVCYLLFSLSDRLWLGLSALLLLGYALAVANVLILTVFQTRTPSGHLTHVMSAVNAISVATLPASLAAVGVFMTRESEVQRTAIGLAFLSLILMLALIGYPVLRRTPWIQEKEDFA